MAISIEKRRALDPVTGKPRTKGPVKAWRVRWDTPAGKRSQTFHTEQAAKAHRATLLADQLRGTYIDPHLGKLLVADFAEAWIVTHHVEHTTKLKIRSNLNAHIIPTFGHLQLREVTVPAVKSWVVVLTNTLGAGTVQSVFATFRTMMAAAVDEGRIVRSPCVKVKLPQEHATEKRYLTVAEVDRILQGIDGRYRAVVLLAAYSGMRWGELAGLQKQDLNILGRRVLVQNVLARVNGGVALRAYPKTKASRRTIMLPRAVCNELALHLERYPTPTGFVFTGARGLPLNLTTFHRDENKARGENLGVWRSALAKAGLADVRFHDLRHTHVAWLIAQNGSMKAVQRRMGHSSIKTTFDVYGHLFEEDEIAIVDGLDAALAAVMEAHQALPAEPIAD